MTGAARAARPNESGYSKGGTNVEYYPVQEWVSEVNQGMADFVLEAEQTLSQRYGRTIQLVKINVIPGMEEMTLFLRAEDDEALNFTARVTGEQVIRDNYVARLRLRECEQALETELARCGVTALVNAELPGCDTTGLPASMPLSALLEHGDVPGIMVRVALRGPEAHADRAAEVLKAFGLRMGKWTVFSVFVFDEAGFEACREPFSTLPTMTEAILSDLDPVAEFSVSVRDGATRMANVKGNALTGGASNGR